MVAGRVGLAPEVWLRLDGLGLSQKGKRDLRWRINDLISVSGVEANSSVTAISRYKAMVTEQRVCERSE